MEKDLRNAVPQMTFRELAERVWVHWWCKQVIGFMIMHCLSSMPQDSILVEVLKDDIADAQALPSYGNCTGGIVKQYSHLGMALPALPYYENPMPISRLQLLTRSCIGSHALPVEQGRLGRLVNTL